MTVVAKKVMKEKIVIFSLILNFARLCPNVGSFSLVDQNEEVAEQQKHVSG